jgi:hypothetical protein
MDLKALVLGQRRVQHQAHCGRVVQLDPVKPTLKPTGAKRLKLKCDVLLSTSAFRLNLRRYIVVVSRSPPTVGRCSLKPADPPRVESALAS